MQKKRLLIQIGLFLALAIGLFKMGAIGCGALSPPAGIPAPVSNFITVSNPDANGNVTVNGSPGSVNPTSTVSGGNTSQGAQVHRFQNLLMGTAYAEPPTLTAMVIANPDGSFQLRLTANVGEVIRLIQIVDGQLSSPTDVIVASDTIALPTIPQGVAVNSDTGIAYVTAPGTDSTGVVHALDLLSSATLLSFPEPTVIFPGLEGIGGIAIDPAQNRGFVISTSDNLLESFDLSKGDGPFTPRSSQTISSPLSIDVLSSAELGAIGVGNTSQSVTLMSTSTSNFLCSFLIGNPGKALHLATPFVKLFQDAQGLVQILAISQFGEGSWLVSRYQFNNCSNIIQNGQVVLPNSVTPGGLAGFNNSANALVTNLDGKDVWVIDFNNNTVSATLPVGNGPKGVAVFPENNHAYVTNSIDNSISSINLTTFLTTTVGSVGLSPNALAIDTNTSEAVVLSQLDHSVVIVNLDF